MNLLGRPGIPALFYYSGKLSEFLVFVSIILQGLGINLRFLPSPKSLLLVFIIISLGVLVFFLGVIELGDSLRMGLPEEATVLKRTGIYRYTRNPIYLSFILIYLAAIIYTMNPLVLILSLYAVAIHHWIILAEERFLLHRFGKEYIDYKGKVRRYI